MWHNKEIDQGAREEKRNIKKKKVRENRRACKKALKNEDYDNINVVNWNDLGDTDSVY